MLQLARHLDLRQLTIMGNDWAGPIGMRVALDETRRLRALVTRNTLYWPADGFGMKAYGYVMSSAPMQKAITERSLMVEGLITMGVEHPLPNHVLAHYAGVLPDPESREAVAELQQQLFSSAFWLGEIEHAVPRILTNVPLLLTWGMSVHRLLPALHRAIEAFLKPQPEPAAR